MNILVIHVCMQFVFAWVLSRYCGFLPPSKGLPCLSPKVAEMGSRWRSKWIDKRQKCTALFTGLPKAFLRSRLSLIDLDETACNWFQNYLRTKALVEDEVKPPFVSRGSSMVSVHKENICNCFKWAHIDIICVGALSHHRALEQRQRFMVGPFC